MGRLLLVGVLLTLVAGCSGGDESYTDRALAEFRAGHAADHYSKKKSPTSKEISAVTAKIKSVAPGSKADFMQAFMVLSSAREHDEYIAKTLGTSRFLRSTYFHVYGKPSEGPKDKAPFKTWAHTCTDGKIWITGHYQVPDDKDYMVVYPPKK
jgi:hypothetical protein